MDAPDVRIDFDPELPISAHVDEIAAALASHQVLVVAGETGSGKTTQLPKICLLAGRKSIGHTQPRRIAARSVAQRVADELGTRVGEVVGYQVRFQRQAGRQTRVKLMTDGILLAEIAHDRDLRRYDTIIVDEAHERSLNIDFLLGYLKQLLARRPELRVIVTSATIDTARFSAHFGDAPIVQVSGRTYPVELRYRPLAEAPAEDDADQVSGIRAAVGELVAEGTGDILVFLSGEREIRDAAEAIAAMDLRATEVLPLYARLSAGEQQRVFSPHSGRRIVLATNVAETSLTVPGIRYVIDPGTARISRYSARTKVQRLPIEAISRASADQRAGRCGRVAPGICIRLYSADDYASRPEFTEPEIKRTNLAAVILQMADADLGDIATFPFVEPPDGSQISDGLRLLRELGALADLHRAGTPHLTPMGRRLARLPVDPRLGRMLLEAERQDCLREVLPIVAGLAIPDVRERPMAAREQADAAHRRFWAPLGADGEALPGEQPDNSDISALGRLWTYLRGAARRLSGNAFRRLCRDEYLSFVRVREWQDLHAQLREACAEVGLNRNDSPATPQRVHTAVLSGLLSHVGLLDTSAAVAHQPGRRRRPLAEYQGARGARFAIQPGSAAQRSSPALVMAVELVETSRLWARTVAPIDAAQIEDVGAHLLHRRYSEPRWSARAGNVVADETVTLYGVPIVAGRAVSYGRIDPEGARAIFIQSALVEGQWRTRHHFFARNARARAEAEELEERSRRRDIVVDDQAIFDFYDARLPSEICSVAHFDSWWRTKRREDDAYLDLRPEDLLAGEAADADEYPDAWTVGGLAVPVDYVFDPGGERDGVTVDVELSRFNQLSAAPFSWQVPGLRQELATELIRSLPKQLRVQLVPAPDVAKAALARIVADESRPFQLALGEAIRAVRGVVVPPDAWRPDAIPDHLRVRFRLVSDGRLIAVGKDLDDLRESHADQLTATLTAAAARVRANGERTWTFGELPSRIEAGTTQHPVVGFPALTDEGGTVGVLVYDSPAKAAQSQAAGLRRLVVLNTPDPTRSVVARLSNATKFALAASPYASVGELLADCRLKAVGDLIGDRAQDVRDQAAFDALVVGVRSGLPERMLALVQRTGEILLARGALERELAAMPASEAKADIEEQARNLVFAGFVAATPEPWGGHLVRYLRAAERRISARRSNRARDDAAAEVIGGLEADYAELCAAQPPGPLPAQVERVGWLIEELRVGLFAQALGTSEPVSAKRVRKALESAASKR